MKQIKVWVVITEPIIGKVEFLVVSTRKEAIIRKKEIEQFDVEMTVKKAELRIYE